MEASRGRFGARGWMIVVLGLAFLLRLYAAGTEDVQSPDTHNYARQAETLRAQGLGSLREEAARFVADPAMLATPPVTRSLFLMLVAGWMKLTATEGVTSVAAYSCVMDLMVCGLLAWFATRVLGLGAACAAVALYAVSPATLSLARHGWSDTSAEVTGLITLPLAVRCLRREGERWPLGALGVAVAVSFGIKESPFVEGCLVLAVVLVLLWKQGRRREIAEMLAAFLGALALMLAWTAFAVGGFGRMMQMFVSSRNYSLVPYLVEYQNGSPGEWVRCLWTIEPVVATLALAGLALFAVKFFKLELQQRAGLLLCAVVLCVFVILPVIGRQLYNVRFVAPAYAPAAVLAAFVLRELWQRLPRLSRLPLTVAGLLLCVTLGMWRFETLIAQPDLKDLSLKMILQGHN